MSISLLERTPSSLAEGDLQRLVVDAVPESLTLDYKWELALDQKSERKEFAADVSSFANKSGGYILVGIAEEAGVPTAVHGVEISDLDAFKLQIGNALGSLVTPKIIGVDIAGVQLASGKTALAIRIPASLGAPHAADGRFFGRSSAGKYPMDITELGAMFRASAGFRDRVLQFHRQRRAEVAQNKWAVDLDPRSRFLLHVVPRLAFDLGGQIDVAATETDWPTWLLERRAMGADYRFNFDGLAVYGNSHSGPAIEGALLYRNGIYEALLNGGLWTTEEGRLRLAPTVFEEIIVSKLMPMLARVASAGSAPPYLCVVSALGVEGVRVILGHTLSEHAIDRSILELPQFEIISLDDDVRRLARPMFDALWQAGGTARSPSYDESGEWVRKLT